MKFWQKKQELEPVIPGAADWWAAIADQTRFRGPNGEVFRMVAIHRNYPSHSLKKMRWPFEVELELEQTIEDRYKEYFFTGKEKQ